MNVLIPMAGAGSRFEQAGYTFPKPLIDVNGKPMIQRVHEAALGSQASEVIVATDSEKIKEVCNQFGAECLMTKQPNSRQRAKFQKGANITSCS